MSTKTNKSVQELAFEGLEGVLLKKALWGSKRTISGLKLSLQEALEDLSMECSVEQYEAIQQAKRNLDKVVHALIQDSKSKTDDLFEALDELCLNSYQVLLLNLLNALCLKGTFFVAEKYGFQRAFSTTTRESLRHEDELQRRLAVQKSVYSAMSSLQDLLALVISDDVADKSKLLIAVAKKVTAP